MKTLLLQTRVDNQENRNEGEVPDKKIVGFEKSKKNYWLQASAIKLLGVNNKTPNAFLDKACKKKSKKEKMNIAIEFYIFEIR